MNQSPIKNHNQTKNSTLVNFITPNQILETFDQICAFQSTTRTSTLIKLMKEFISHQSASIPHQIQSIENLKNGLSKFEISKVDRAVNRRPLKTFSEFNSQKYNRSEPITFFITED